jgi:type II secretory pathway pseudopilin PulG
MKKTTVLLTAGLFIIGTALFLSFQGCAGGEDTSTGVKSVGKTSFREVTSHLDKGGTFYLYASTEKIIRTVDEFMGNIRKMLEVQAVKSPEGAAEGLKYFDFFYNLFKKSGITEVSGIGVSSVPIEGGLNHSKVVVHHFKGKGGGVLWQMAAGKSDVLPYTKLLPADTVMAGFGHSGLNLLWEWFKKEVEAADLPKLKQGILSLEPMLQDQGIDLNKLLGALSGPMGYVVTLDNVNKKTIPIGKGMLEIPDPGFALVFSVADDYLFSLLQGKMTFAKLEEKDGDKRLLIPMGMKPMPITLEPVIVQSRGKLFVASNTKIVEAMLAAEKSGKGLTASEEFKKLSARMPGKGNGFRFTSQRFIKAISDVWSNATQAAGKESKQGAEAFKFFSTLLPKDITVYAVTRYTGEGTVTTLNHTMGVEHLMLMPALVTTGIVAAVAIPKIITATQKGKQKATMGDMKSIMTAIESYITDNYYAPKAKNMEELQKLLVPFYIRRMPLTDAWGFPFHYSHGSDDNKDTYFLGSGGKDGVFNGFDQTGFYWVNSTHDFNNDIIVSNGTFVYGPKVK